MNELTFALQVSGRIDFVSGLFPMCDKAMRIELIISVRDFRYVCGQDASCIMLVAHILVNSCKEFASCVRAEIRRDRNRDQNISSFGLDCFSSRPLRRLEIMFSSHPSGLALLTVWETAPVCVGFMDPKMMESE